uniref:Putative structural protein n=1 Tax=viral metagenome TaxID=1070528 RepID=A0A6H1ZDP4_9ZZZZ
MARDPLQLDPESPLDYIGQELEQQADQVDAPATPVERNELEPAYVNSLSVRAELDGEREREQMRVGAGLYGGGGQEKEPMGATGGWGGLGPVEYIQTQDGGNAAINRLTLRDGSEIKVPAIGDPGWEETDWGRKFRSFVSGMTTSTGDMIGMFGEWAGSKGFKDTAGRLVDIGEAINPEDTGFTDDVARTFGSAASFWLPGLGTMGATAKIATKAPQVARWLGVGVSSVLEAGAEGHAALREAQGLGYGPDEARAVADRTFWMNLPLLVVTNRLGIFEEAGGLKGALGGAAGEAVQEGAQTVISEEALGREPRIKDVAYSMLLGGIVGGALGPLTEGRSRAESRQDRFAADLAAKRPLTPDGVYDIHEARLLGLMPEREYGLARHFEGIFPEADYKTYMGVVNGTMFTAQDIRGLSVSRETGADQVLGVTITQPSVEDDASVTAGDTMMLFFEGRDTEGDTIVHEASHRVFHHLPLELQNEFQSYLGQESSNYENLDEAFAEKSTEFFFDQKYDKTVAGGAFDRVHAVLHRTVARAFNQGAEIPGPVRNAFMENVRPRISQGKATTGEVQAAIGPPGQPFMASLDEFLSKRGPKGLTAQDVVDLLNKKALSPDYEAQWSGLRAYMADEQQRTGKPVSVAKVREFIDGAKEKAQTAYQRRASDEMNPPALTTAPGSAQEERARREARVATLQSEVAALRGAPDGPLIKVQNLAERLGKAAELAELGEGEMLAKGAVKDFQAADWAKFINFGRINSPDEVKALIARMYQMDPEYWTNEVKGKRPWALVEKQANSLGMSPYELMARRKGTAFNDTEMEVLRRATEGAAVRLAELRDEVLNAPTGQADAAKAAFQGQLQLVYAMQETMMDAKATAARSLAILRKQAEPGAMAGQQMLDSLEAARERGFDPADLASALLDMNSPGQIAAAVRQTYQVNGWDMILEMRQTGLLWGPWTHARNVLGNSLGQMWLVGERQIAGLAPGGEIGIGESAHMVHGFFEGALDGMRMAWYALKNDAPQTGSEKFDPRIYGAISGQNLQNLRGPFGSIEALRKAAPRAMSATGWVGRAFDFFGETTRLTYRALGAEDAFFRGVAERMELHALAYRQARQESRERGLNGVEERDYRADRMASIIMHPENHQEILQSARDFGHYATYTNELGKLGKQMMRASYNQRGGQFIRLLAPFVRTPINLMKFAAARLPVVNTLAPSFYQDFNAGGARRESALARAAMSWMIFGLVGYLVFNDRLTGEGPRNRRVREGWYEKGWQPNAVRVGNKLVGFDNTDPVGAIVGMQANFWELMRWSMFTNDANWEEVAAAAVLSPTKYMMNQTYLRGIADFMRLATEPEDRVGDPKAVLKTQGARWIQSTALSFVPLSGALRHARRMVDPTVRATETMLERLKDMTPGWSKTLPPLRGLWGDIRQRDEMLGPDVISPLPVKDIKRDPLDALVADNNMRLYMPGRYVSRGGAQVRLTPQQYGQLLEMMFQEREGVPNLRDRVKAALSQPGAERMSPIAKEEMINDMRRDAANQARQQLLMQNEDLSSVLNYQAQKRAAEASGQATPRPKVAPPSFE